jgi:hypothetical protein
MASYHHRHRCVGLAEPMSEVIVIVGMVEFVDVVAAVANTVALGDDDDEDDNVHGRDGDVDNRPKKRPTDRLTDDNYDDNLSIKHSLNGVAVDAFSMKLCWRC